MEFVTTLIGIALVIALTAYFYKSRSTAKLQKKFTGGSVRFNGQVIPPTALPVAAEQGVVPVFGAPTIYAKAPVAPVAPVAKKAPVAPVAKKAPVAPVAKKKPAPRGGKKPTSKLK